MQKGSRGVESRNLATAAWSPLRCDLACMDGIKDARDTMTQMVLDL